MFTLSFDGDLARLLLDRPEVRNAIPLHGWDMLGERVAEVARSDARLLIVQGAGSAFCAGADLSEFGRLQADAAERTRFRTAMRNAYEALASLPIPVIARVHGACFGAGVALALACDIIEVAPAARFAITPARIGISYPQGDVHRLVQRIGPGQAARMLFSAATIDAEEALRIGLADVLEDPSTFILANDPASLRALKRSLRLAGAGHAGDEEQDRLFDSLFGSPALAERLGARKR
jgi:enoyl-CoA hydratase/carnithine racemase